MTDEKTCILEITTSVGGNVDTLVKNTHKFDVVLVSMALLPEGKFCVDDADYFRILTPVVNDFMFYINYGEKNVDKPEITLRAVSVLYESGVKVGGSSLAMYLKKNTNLERDVVYHKLHEIFAYLMVNKNA
jgi:hypothetical protein